MIHERRRALLMSFAGDRLEGEALTGEDLRETERAMEAIEEREREAATPAVQSEAEEEEEREELEDEALTAGT
jgi:hypothetical protein